MNLDLLEVAMRLQVCPMTYKSPHPKKRTATFTLWSVKKRSDYFWYKMSPEKVETPILGTLQMVLSSRDLNKLPNRLPMIELRECPFLEALNFEMKPKQLLYSCSG